MVRMKILRCYEQDPNIDNHEVYFFNNILNWNNKALLPIISGFVASLLMGKGAPEESLSRMRHTMHL